MAFGPQDFAERTGVSRETLARLKAYADLLTDWNARHNLVAKSTLPDLWHRHIWDSAQLAPLSLLLQYAHNFLGFGGICLFLKGQNVESELTEATKYWNMKTSRTPSLTDPSGAIVVVRELGPRHVQKAPNPG